VLKILLGDVAKAKKLKQVERILADSDEILTAIFERTYANLSPTAQRVFLTLSNWRSTLPLLAIEAVLLRPENEKMAVREGVEELERSSLVEVTEADADGQVFINAPLVASLFGKRKLLVSPMRSAVQADTELLYHFGAGQPADVRHGVGPRIRRVFQHVARRIGQGDKLADYTAMLEFIARQYSPAWMFLAELHEEAGTSADLDATRDAIQHYLESQPVGDLRVPWQKLAEISRRTSDTNGELHALVEICDLPETPYGEVSSSANRFNQALKTERDEIDPDSIAILLGRLIAIMESRITEANATDCSRLAWLHINDRNEGLARPYVERGLALDPHNEHCQGLAAKLQISLPSGETAK
jgi:hypothetical protein